MTDDYTDADRIAELSAEQLVAEQKDMRDAILARLAVSEPAHLQLISVPFHELARLLVETLPAPAVDEPLVYLLNARERARRIARNNFN
jgi:hypothetical protein